MKLSHTAPCLSTTPPLCGGASVLIMQRGGARLSPTRRPLFSIRASGNLVDDPRRIAANTSFACPCCGYHTLDREPPGSLAVCPVCYWQDASSDEPSHNL